MFAAFPCILDLSERYAFCVHMKFPARGMRHNLLKGLDEDLARWNTSSAEDC
jgi:hypothetical protein